MKFWDLLDMISRIDFETSKAYSMPFNNSCAPDSLLCDFRVRDSTNNDDFPQLMPSLMRDIIYLRR